MKKSKVGTRLLSAIMALMMLAGLLPASALATDGESTSAFAAGTYTITANLHVPQAKNTVAPLDAYLTNTNVPPTAPVSKNAKLVVDSDGTMMLTIKNLNEVFSLQNIEDGDGLHITNRFIQQGKYGSCTSRISGLEIQLLEKKDVYEFTNCKEMPTLFGDDMDMTDMPIQLEIDYSCMTEGYTDMAEAYTRIFRNAYKGFDDALTYMDVTVSTSDADAGAKLENATLTVTALDENSVEDADKFKNEYLDPKPFMQFFKMELTDANGVEIELDKNQTKMALSYGARTFDENGTFPDIMSYEDGTWTELDRITTQTDNVTPTYMATTDHMGVFCAVENNSSAMHWYEASTESDGVRWDVRSVLGWSFREMVLDYYLSPNQSQTTVEGVGTAYQLKQTVASTDVAKENTTVTLTLPHQDGVNYYLVTWNKETLDQRKLTYNTTDDGNDIVSVIHPSEDADYVKYAYNAQTYMKNDFSTDNTKKESAFVLATTKKLAEVEMNGKNPSLTYTGETVTAPFEASADQMEITGNTGIDSGKYTASLTPKGEYIRADGTQTAKTAQWRIANKKKIQIEVNLEEDAINYGDTFDGKIVLTDPDGKAIDNSLLSEAGQKKLSLTSVISENIELDDNNNIPVGTYDFNVNFDNAEDLTEEAAKEYKFASKINLKLTVFPTDADLTTAKMAAAPNIESATKTWTGLEQCLVDSNWSIQGGLGTNWTVSGQNWGKEPGKYTAIIAPMEGVYWTDGTTDSFSVDWYIKKTATAPTAVEGLTYNGKEQVGVPEGEGYTVTGGTAKEAGTHTATVTLDEYYMWSDSGLADSFEVEYTIASVSTSVDLDAEDKQNTITANLYVPGSLNTKLPGVTAYLTNGDNPNGEDGYAKKAPTQPVYNNAILTTHADGTRTLVLDIPNPVFTLQKLSGAPEGVTVERMVTVTSSAPSGTRISQVTIDLPAEGDTFVFTDCEEYPTLLMQTWTVDLTLKLGTSGLDSKTDVDTSGSGGGGSSSGSSGGSSSGSTGGGSSSGSSGSSSGSTGGGSSSAGVTPETVIGFTDVEADAYYKAAVDWAVANDVTSGTTDTTFSPDNNCTRAQIVTFIWRALAE